MCYYLIMFIFDTTQPTNATPIIVIIFSSLLGLCLICLALYIFVFSKNKLKRKVRELDRKFTYLHALLIGDCAQFVKRLEIISRTNLLYVDVHTKFLLRFKEVRDRHDSISNRKMNELKDLLDEKKYKNIKEVINDTTEIIEFYEKEVNSLHGELTKVIKPEEDCRQSSVSLKDKLRRVKQDYYAKQVDLSLCKSSFDASFAYIDKIFESFEDYIEKAHYDEANDLLPKVNKILDELIDALSCLPNICALIVTVIPEKIQNLENAYIKMCNESFPLHHLKVSSNIKEMKRDLEKFTEEVKIFNYKHIASLLNDIINRIEEYFVLFEEERQARDFFENEVNSVYKTVNNIEKQFIKLCNKIPEVEKIYIINPKYQSNIIDIQNEINKLGAFKRSLDTYIHSSTKQPYTLFLKKIEELQSASNCIISKMDDFKAYLESLKTECEAAHKLILESYAVLKESEHNIKSQNIKTLTLKYSETFDQLYEYLNHINYCIGILPIDVSSVSENVKLFNTLYMDKIAKNGSIDSDLECLKTAEISIIHSSEHRRHLSDVNKLILQSESLFFNGEFEKSCQSTMNALNKTPEAEGRR